MGAAFRRGVIWLVRGLWNFLKLIAVAVWPTRVPLGLIVAGAFMLVLHEQGQDLAIRLVEASETSDGMLAWTLFFLATLWWSLQSWLWARIACTQHFGELLETDPDGSPATLPIKWVGDDRVRRSRGLRLLVGGLPRFYAAAVFALAVYSIYQIGGASRPSFWVFSLTGAAVGIALWFRRDLLELVRHRAPPNWQQMTRGAARAGARFAAAALAVADVDRTKLTNLFGASPAGRTLAIASLFVAGGMAVAICVYPGPQCVGAWLGAPAVTFMAFASILAALGMVAGVSHRTHLPVLASLLVLAALVPVVGKLLMLAHVTWFVNASWFGDHHRIAASAAPVEQRRNLEAAWDEWQKASPTPAGSKPIIFTATAGGGIRAALWTVVVLDRARVLDKDFDNRQFVLSGVSGGALGATAYVAALASNAKPSPDCERNTSKELGALGRVGFCMFEADMLGPTFAAALYGDLLFTFLPWPAPVDSAGALTRSWEEAWRKAVTSGKATDAFSQPLLRQYDAVAWRPVLLLNGTHVETGKRIITSDLKLEGTSVRDAWDFHAIVGGDISTSMAALNAARFPGVVAAGTVTTIDGRRWGHVIDGGYFENSGGLGALELARDVARIAAEKKVRLRPVFIEILSDPDAGPRDYQRGEAAKSVAACHKANPKDEKKENPCYSGGVVDFLIGLTGPLNGILNVRSGHGVWSPWHFRDHSMDVFPAVVTPSSQGERQVVATETPKSSDAPKPEAAVATNPTFLQLRLCPPKEGARVPLGWQLSDHSAMDIVGSLPVAKPAQQSEPTETATDIEKANFRRWQCERDNFGALEALKAALTD
jgi:hypothetical protein